VLKPRISQTSNATGRWRKRAVDRSGERDFELSV
jgi:hypothetical protein